MAFELPDLPYPHDALAGSGMSKETLEFHHDIHHKAYVDNGNKADRRHRVGEQERSRRSSRAPTRRAPWRRTASSTTPRQHWNHSQFWQMDEPEAGGDPGALEKALTDAFGSVDKFKEEFSAAGAGQFGSGWAWLVKDGGVAEGDQDRERGEPALLRPDRAPRLRRLGAFLLHRLPQQAAGLPHQLPRQAGELGERRLAAVALCSSRRRLTGRLGAVDSPLPRRAGGSFQEVQDQAGSQRSGLGREEAAVGRRRATTASSAAGAGGTIRPLPRPGGFRRGRRAGPASARRSGASSSGRIAELGGPHRLDLSQDGLPLSSGP